MCGCAFSEERRNVNMKSQSKYTSITIHELLVLISFSTLFIMKGVGIYEGMLAFNISIVVSFLCAGFAMLMANYTIPEVIGAIVLLGCSFLAYFETGEKAAIAAVLIVIGMKNVFLERMMKLAFALWTVCFYGMLFVHLIGWKEDIILAHNKFGLGFLLRRSLGFPHPNVLHISFIIWMALFLYVWSGTEKKLLKVTIILSMANILMFFYSVSITGMGLGFIYLGGNYFFAIRKEFNKLESCLIKSVLPICILACIIPPLFFKGTLFNVLNKLLNTRMNIWKYYLTTFTPGIFGTAVYPPGEHQMSLDGSYLYLLYYYGWFLFIIFIGLTFWTICRCIKKGHKKELAIILGLSIAGIVEPFLYNFSAKNLILIFVGYELFDALKESRGKGINFLPWGKSEIRIKKLDITVETMQQCWNEVKCKCIVAGVVVGTLVAICTMFLFEKPEQIYVQRIRCDYIEDNGIFQNEIENVEECWILGADNTEARFVGFSGKMITLEWIRAMAANGVMTGSISSGIIYLIEIYIIEKRKNKAEKI